MANKTIQVKTSAVTDTGNSPQSQKVPASNKKLHPMLMILGTWFILVLCSFCSIIFFFFGFAYLILNTPVSEESTSLMLDKKYKKLCDYDAADLEYKFANHPSNAHTVGVGNTKYSADVVVFYKGNEIYNGKFHVIVNDNAIYGNTATGTPLFECSEK